MASLSRKRRTARPRPHMNITPLVDVVLVLLIIFMIVIPAMTEGLNLEVPAISNVDLEGNEGPEPTVLSINANGTLLLDDRAVPERDLEAQLRGAHRRRPRSRLVLRGDRGVAYGRVRDLFARAQSVGFPGVSLRVSHRPDPGQE